MKIEQVIVYVEGPSDKLAMQVLLKPLLQQKMQAGVRVDFFDIPKGDRKVAIVSKAPIRAVNILMNNDAALVIAMPDLYPRNKGFPHETLQELMDGINRNFITAMSQRGLAKDARYLDRFKVFCFKHDLEALLLAAEEGLQRRFGGGSLGITWKKPVEEQDQDYPPKMIVHDIFKKHGQRYIETIDAPLILSGVPYQEIAERCPQCFQPFVEFLEKLS